MHDTLALAIHDFTFMFDRVPNAIKIPFWRLSELTAKDRKHIGCPPSGASTFLGIKLTFEIDSDVIELE